MTVARNGRDAFEDPCRCRWVYEVSGFVFETGEPFPDLGETSSPPVSQFLLGGGPAPANCAWYHRARLADGRSWPAFGRSATEFVVDFEGACVFTISADGSQTRGHAIPGTPNSTVRRLYLDQVIPLILNLRGRECLHASAVLLNGVAQLFIGPSGAGKSTLAAALSAPGRPLLTDDCAALDLRPDGFIVHVGNRGSKLWPDSARALCGDAALPQVAGHDAKRLLGHDGAPPRSAPVGGIYLLETAPPGTLPGLRDAGPSEVVPVLMEAAFRLDITDPAMLERQFRFLMQFASTVPLRRLSFAHDFAQLPAVCELVAAEAEAR